MCDVDVEAIEARLAAITPGHWVAGTEIEPEDGCYWAAEDILCVDELPVPDYSRATSETAGEAEAERVSAWADKHYRGAIASTHNHLSVPEEQHDANQQFIAHAPDDLRSLITEVRRLRALLAARPGSRLDSGRGRKRTGSE